MRKFKIGNVYSADCFNDRGEKVDRGDGYWHFKIIEVVRGYQNRKGYNIYIGIKVDMNDYQKPSTNYLVESFNSDGVSLDGEHYHFKLKRNITEKQGMEIRQREKLLIENYPNEFKSKDPKVDDIEQINTPASFDEIYKDELESVADRIKANPSKYA